MPLGFFKKSNSSASVATESTKANDTSNELDTVAEAPAQKKPGVEQEYYTNKDSGSRAVDDDDNKSAVSTVAEVTKQAAAKSRDKVEYASESESDDDIEPVDVLLQFIPYYGRGDASNDSIVRSTLKGLSVQDIDSKDEYGNTLLLLACQYRCEDLVRIMLNKGADPNAVNSSGACCLHFACYRDSSSYQIAKILLANGANPDVAESSFGCTPLHYCAGTGDIEFCKLLLSAGALVNTCDFYNYTCIDYAREAGMAEVAAYLQQRFDKVTLQQRQSFGSMSSMRQFLPQNQTPVTPVANIAEDMSNWESHVDPDTKMKYYIHSKTGECLWQDQLKQRILQAKQQLAAQQQQQQQQQSSSQKSPKPSSPKKLAVNTAGDAQKEAFLITQATTARLIAFFSKHDPARLLEIETLVVTYKGKESELMSELCEKYNVKEDADAEAFQKKLNDIKAANGPAPMLSSPSGKGVTFSGTATDISQVDPMVIQEINSENRKKFEQQVEQERLAAKTRFDAQLEEERAEHRKTVSERDGEISKLKTEIETLQRSKTANEEEIGVLKGKMDKLQMSRGEADTQSEAELESIKKELSECKDKLSQAQQAVAAEKEKISSLETSLANVSAGNEEIIARENAAADQRAQQQQQREAEFAAEIKEMEQKHGNNEMRMKQEFNQQKKEWAASDKEAREQTEAMKASMGREIEALRKELAEIKAQAAQESSSANMQISDLTKSLETAQATAQEAVDFQRRMQDELDQAKIVQKYNAQLHKDLQREQLQRKKLHNDMEDLKGKIRVYVRVRPFSKKESERGCTESVIKDGKMTVLVKGIGAPDAKKFYDFDSVFAGQDGNTQTDVFRDTKHLCMSVIDGYNVCIFAYGQTGAGKSFTMIGAADIGKCLDEKGEFDELAGITPRAVSEVFRLLNERTAQVDFQVEIQMFQLYRDGLEDLLKDPKAAKKAAKDEGKPEKPPSLKITLAEHSPTGLVHVEGATTCVVTSAQEVMGVFAQGSARRATASTQMNAESSRSHLICSLVVRLTNKRTGRESVGKLTLVDLAGSERLDKSGAVGENLKEAQSINKSLSALGDVISSLTTGQSHVPYRNHPLTMLMSDSIGGNAKTLMFVNTSPADYNAPESDSALKFASRCKDITNNVAAGPGVQAAQVSALKKELAKLKKGGAGSRAPPPQMERPSTAQKR